MDRIVIVRQPFGMDLLGIAQECDTTREAQSVQVRLLHAHPQDPPLEIPLDRVVWTPTPAEEVPTQPILSLEQFRIQRDVRLGVAAVEKKRTKQAASTPKKKKPAKVSADRIAKVCELLGL